MELTPPPGAELAGDAKTTRPEALSASAEFFWAPVESGFWPGMFLNSKRRPKKERHYKNQSE
jgi:hypothetical protein